MRRAAVMVLLAGLLPLVGASPALARSPPRDAPRTVDARARRGEELRKLFTDAGLPAVPPRLYLRIFKKERQVELWGGKVGAPMVLVKTFEVCADSGVLGPKRRRGDLQVPEGFYGIDRYNAWSNFHLSLGLDYPNRSDRIRGRALGVEDLGGDIFVHGSCVTIGCVPIEDGPIELLFLATLDTHLAGQERIPVHVFPARLTDAGLADLRAEHDDPQLQAFWKELQPGYLHFERTHRPPRVRVHPDGRYHLTPVGEPIAP
ncbi:MAG: hypothetical protein P1V51_15660 [Deltaproteobacteria bacterium]|nr:hypothetical protein [Deltaproteobacteria bacterium]